MKMKNNTDLTLEYYEKKAQSFSENTQSIDFLFLQKKFLSYLSPQSLILDLGCGAGRDSKFFITNNHKIIAIDGCKKLCNIASNYIKQPVQCVTFQHFQPKNLFDGIWACASLLHLEKTQIITVVNKLTLNLKKDGVFFMSFKKGTYSGIRNGRYFNDFTKAKFMKILPFLNNLSIISIFETQDVRYGREKEIWLNIFLSKIN